MDTSSSRRLFSSTRSFEGRERLLGWEHSPWTEWSQAFREHIGQVAVTNMGCFLSHKQIAFCRAQNILEVFGMFCGCSAEFLMCLWGVSFSTGTGTRWVRLSQCDSWLEGICYCARCAGLPAGTWHEEQVKCLTGILHLLCTCALSGGCRDWAKLRD